MDFLIQNGISVIIAIQGLGAWLEAPMKFFSSLGYENFFLLILPLLYWSVDAGLGLRDGVDGAANDFSLLPPKPCQRGIGSIG